jgi:hypothetical protein
MRVDGKRIKRAAKLAKVAAIALNYAGFAGMCYFAILIADATPIEPGFCKVVACLLLGGILGASIQFGRVAVDWFVDRVIADSIEIVDGK